MKPGYAIADVLPHEGDMMLLDELVDLGEDYVTCAVRVREHTRFCDPVHGVPAWVGIEYMAQTMCAFSGVEEVRAGFAPSIGLLLGSRRYDSAVDWFPIGSDLLVRAELQLRDENDLVAFDCTIHEGGRQLACADIKAYRPRDVLAVLRGERTVGR